MPIGIIQSLDHEARGIARQDGKAIFIEGALPGERVEYASFRKKASYEMAHLVEVLSPSSNRIEPRCPHYGVCGGCAMQHLDPLAQVAAKQRVLEDSLWHIGRVRADEILPPIQGETWGYRHRARLGVRKISKKAGMLLGFHERRSSFIADIRQCDVLPQHVSDLLLPLRQLIAALSIAERVPQVDVAVGEHCTVLLLRVLAPLAAVDEKLLRNFLISTRLSFIFSPRGRIVRIAFTRKVLRC